MSIIAETPVDYMYRIRQDKHTHPLVDKIFKDETSVEEYKFNHFYVYILYNEETKEFYIGSGIKNKRHTDHLRRLEYGRLDVRDVNGNKYFHHGNKKFQEAYNRNQSFKLYCVLQHTRKEAFAYEQLLLDQFWNTPGRLNLARYVELPTLGMKFSPERIAQIVEHNKKMWSNPEHYKKVFNEESNKNRRESLKIQYANGRPGVMRGKKHREGVKEQISGTLSKLWEDPRLRELQSKRATAMQAAMTPEQRQKIIEGSRANTTELWKDSNYRNKVISSITEAFKAPELRKQRSISSKSYSNRLEVKEARRISHQKHWADPEFKKRVSNAIKEAHKDPELRRQRSIVSKEYSNRPEVKAARSKVIKDLFKNPEYAKRHREMAIARAAKQSVSIIIKGVEYQSKRVASRLTGISRRAIKKYLADPNNLDFIYKQ